MEASSAQIGPTKSVGLLLRQIRTEHMLAADARMVCLEVCLRTGTDLRPSDREELLQWRCELRRSQQVVVYSPRTVEGWLRLPREPADDDIIRWPAREFGERGVDPPGTV